MEPYGAEPEQRQPEEIQPVHVAVDQKGAGQPAAEREQEGELIGNVFPLPDGADDSHHSQRQAEEIEQTALPEREGVPDQAVALGPEQPEQVLQIAPDRPQPAAAQDAGRRLTALREAGKGDAEDHGLLPAQGADRLRRRDRQGQQHEYAQRQQRRLPAEPPSQPNQQAWHQQRQKKERGAVGVEGQGKTGRRSDQQPGPLSGQHREIQSQQQEAGEQVAFQAPAAHHDMPGVQGEDQQGGESEARPADPPRQPPEDPQRQAARQRVGQPGREGAESEQRDPRHGEIAHQGVLSAAPGGQQHGPALAAAVDPVMEDGPGVVARAGLVLVQPHGQRSAERQPQRAAQDQQQPGEQPLVPVDEIR